jgi:hypothetical protein
MNGKNCVLHLLSLQICKTRLGLVVFAIQGLDIGVDVSNFLFRTRVTILCRKIQNRPTDLLQHTDKLCY